MCVPPWLEIIKECSFGVLGSSTNESAVHRPARPARRAACLFISVYICLSISQLLTALQCSSNTWPLHLRSRTWKQQHTRLLWHIKCQRTQSLWIHTAKRVGSEVRTKQMSRVYLIGICCSPKYLSTKTESSILRLVILARSRFDSVVTLQSTMLDGACTAPGWGHVEPWQLHSHLPPCLSMISSP